MSDVDVQPSGEVIEETLAVVSHILSAPEFAEKVRQQNSWIDSLTDQETAILFLASRYQGSMALLSLQTSTLQGQIAGLAVQIEGIEARQGG